MNRFVSVVAQAVGVFIVVVLAGVVFTLAGCGPKQEDKAKQSEAAKPQTAESIRASYARAECPGEVGPKQLQRRQVEFKPPTSSMPIGILTVVFCDVTDNTRADQWVAKIVRRELEEHLKEGQLPSYGILACGFTSGDDKIDGSNFVYVKQVKKVMLYAEYERSEYYKQDGGR